MYYAELKPVLRQWPTYFHGWFDDGRWAVYEVSGS
jgi:hypothetical protein